MSQDRLRNDGDLFLILSFTNTSSERSPFFWWWRAPQQMLRTHRSLEGLLCNPVMKMITFSFFLVMEHRWNETDRGKPKYSGKTCPSVTLSTTNPTWTDPGSNPGLRGERPATNRLSHGTAEWSLTFKCFGLKFCTQLLFSHPSVWSKWIWMIKS
jgi:hypothetical protein